MNVILWWYQFQTNQNLLETELPTGHLGVGRSPEIVTHCSPLAIIVHLHKSDPAEVTRAHYTDVTIYRGTCRRCVVKLNYITYHVNIVLVNETWKKYNSKLQMYTYIYIYMTANV